MGSSRLDCYHPPTGPDIQSPTAVLCHHERVEPKRSKMSITDEAKANSTNTLQCETQFPSVNGYLCEVGAKTVLRHIAKTDPSIILNLPMVVRERTAYAKTKVEITQDREHRTHDDLKRKSVHLKSQLTKSLKRQSKAEGLASAARTRLATAKAQHASTVNQLEQSKKKSILKYKAQHMQHTTLVEGLRSSMRELNKVGAHSVSYVCV